MTSSRSRPWRVSRQARSPLTSLLHPAGSILNLVGGPNEVEHGSGLGAFLKWGGKPHYLPYPSPCPTLPCPTQPFRASSDFHFPKRSHPTQRDWYFIAEQPAPAPHLAHPEGCAALRIVPSRASPHAYAGHEGSLLTPISVRSRASAVCSGRGGSYRGTSLIRNSFLLGPYSRPMPRVLWWSYGGGSFL